MKRIYLLPLPVLMAAALAGCHSGQDANTTMQDETGNGIKMEAGAMQVASVTIVAGDEGSGVGAVSAVLVNNGMEPEELVSITVAGDEAELTPGEVVVEAGSSVPIASNAEVQAEVPLDALAGEFVEVAFLFGSAGVASDDVLVVPAIGYYEPYAPAGATDEDEAGDDEPADAEPADEAPADARPADEAPADEQ